MLIALSLAAAATPAFDPLRFFTGPTRGTGELKVIFRKRVPIHVRGSGRITPDGTLILDQNVVEGQKPPRDRQWRLRQVAPGRYSGTLTDARGPVIGDIEGGRLNLRFTTKDGFGIRQTLTPDATGRVLDNRLTVHRFGITVATLRERIVRP